MTTPNPAPETPEKEKLKLVLKVIDGLKVVHDEGDYTFDGEEEHFVAGNPDWEKAKEDIKKIFEP
ncbi:MAG: hypothetical protein Q8L24_02005 [bacterium]|nr:hypothetical protein [bacterium]